MAAIPVEKELSPRQMRRRFLVYRLVMPIFTAGTRALRGVKGQRLVLNTQVGPVRALVYGFDRPEVLPLFVNIHGGGFTLGSAEMDDPFMPRVAAGAGVKTLSLDYSLAPEKPFPAALNECFAAVTYAKEHARELGIDADRIAVGGHSAGGNLSAGICLLDADKKSLGIKALVLDYPPLDLHTDPFLKPCPKKAIPPKMARLFDAAYAGSREAARNPLISPRFASAEQLRTFPPTLMISAGQDSLMPEETAFKDRLIEAGVPVTYRLFEGVAHGFTLKRGREADEAWQLMTDYLKRQLAPAPPAETAG